MSRKSFSVVAVPWRTHSCVPRSHSCERLLSISDLHWTKDNPPPAKPTQPSPDFSQCTLQSCSTPPHLEPNDRRTRAAKIARPSDEQPVGFTRRDAFQRLQQQAWRNRGQQEQVNVIRHDDKRPEEILSQSFRRETANRLPAWRFLLSADAPDRCMHHPGSDPPTRKLHRPTPCEPAENGSLAGCRADAR